MSYDISEARDRTAAGFICVKKVQYRINFLVISKHIKTTTTFLFYFSTVFHNLGQYRKKFSISGNFWGSGSAIFSHMQKF